MLTLYPGVAGGDSGELIAAVAGGGVIHPPGYPLYAVLGKIFVPGSPPGLAWRLNLFSALCDAGAATLLSVAVARRTGSPWAGITAGGLFAFAPGIWSYAVCAEVFALNNLIVAALLCLAVLYDERAERRYALLGALTIGVGLSNHHTSLFVALPVVVWAAWRGRDLRELKTASLLFLLFGVGLLPYLYLPVAGASHSAVSWGATDTWSGFWTHVLRREYGTFQLAPGGASDAAVTPFSTLHAWGSDLVDQLGVWALPLGVVGAWACLRAPQARPFGAMLVAAPGLAVGVIMLLGNLPVSDALHRGIVARFWQEPDIFVFALCGLAVAEVEARSTAWVAAAFAFAALASPVFRWRAMDRSRSTLARSYGAEILRAAPRGALLFTRGDLVTNTVRYLQLVESQRSDVRVVDLELLGFPWYRAELARLHPDVIVTGGLTIAELLDANIPRVPILLCGGVKQGDGSADRTYGFWPFGLCDIVHSGSEPVNLDAWLRDSEAALPRIDFAAQPRPPGSWEEVVWKDYWEVRQARAAHLLAIVGGDPARRRYIGIAADVLSNIVSANPGAPAHVYKNLAIALGRSGLDSPEQRTRVAGAWRHYLEAAPKSDPELPVIERELRRLESR